MTIEEEIARTLAEWRSGEYAEPWEVDMYMDAATALSPLLNRVRAEAIREVGRVEFQPTFGVSYSGIDAQERLHRAADRIEQNSEGNGA